MIVTMPEADTLAEPALGDCLLDTEDRPNAVTLAAMQETEDIISGKVPGAWHQSPEDCISALKNEIER